VKAGPPSRTPGQLGQGDSAPISGDVPEHAAALKAQNGPGARGHGSAGLIETLLGQYLIDELRAWIFACACERAGEIEPGSLASGEPEPAGDRAERGGLARGPGGSHKW
jgi:hypothetical protein